ncbi:MAG: glycoside hydrolase family 13 protein [Clostridia bacterium]|nr:glycoside hydrolase family 13 protein [Clostridia bacterium]
MFYIPYNSRKTYHKNPFGAVACGEETVFRIILQRSLCCRAVWLVIHRDGEAVEYLPATWDCMEKESEEWWKITYRPSICGIYWYHFEYDTDYGRTSVTNIGNGVAKITKDGTDWQLTVYDKAVRTPDWIKGGIMYQIFPDRFFSSGQKKDSVPSDRVIRDDWGVEPMWEPDQSGRINKYDFFCGDLKGIEQKLPYLSSLSVNCIYLNPIFEAASNHRYDTADYEKIDPLLGDEEDFESLCKSAEKYNIRIILDGVFSHTGADSRYFNKCGRYGNDGAYNTKESRFFDWYKFRSWPDSYESWWGIDILPEVCEETPSYIDYIGSVCDKWMQKGASGWRLDVADELPDIFLESFFHRVKKQKPDAFVLGEVWEDATNKISYGHRRKYLLGNQMDSVMNYPFANAVMRFLTTGSAESFMDRVLSVLENYPPQSIHTLMNHIGTHDTARAITALAATSSYDRSAYKNGSGRLSDSEYRFGISLMKSAAVLQFTLPGVPCIYYGDEAGMQGGEDPFNRGCFPWGNENTELLSFYQKLGSIRRKNPCFTDGEFIPVSGILGCVAYARKKSGNACLTIVNRNEHSIDYLLPFDWQYLSHSLGGERISSDCIRLDACSATILY